MNKLLKILFILPLIFSSCEEEDNTPSVSPPPTSSVTTGFLSNQYGVIFKTTDSGDTWTYHDGINSFTGRTSGNFNRLSFP